MLKTLFALLKVELKKLENLEPIVDDPDYDKNIDFQKSFDTQFNNHQVKAPI